MSKFIYLAGPIDGCDEGEAKNWRKYVSDRFTSGIVGISPLRCEPAVDGKYSGVYSDPKFGTARAIFNKNLLDTTQCDMVFAHLPNRNDGQVSIGTTLEIGWATAFRKPIVIVSDYKKVIEHPDIIGSNCWILNTLEEGIELVNGIYTDYTRSN